MSEYYCRLHRRPKGQFRSCADCEMDRDPIVYSWI